MSSTSQDNNQETKGAELVRGLDIHRVGVVRTTCLTSALDHANPHWMKAYNSLYYSNLTRWFYSTFLWHMSYSSTGPSQTSQDKYVRGFLDQSEASWRQERGYPVVFHISFRSVMWLIIKSSWQRFADAMIASMPYLSAFLYVIQTRYSLLHSISAALKCFPVALKRFPETMPCSKKALSLLHWSTCMLHWSMHSVVSRSASLLCIVLYTCCCAASGSAHRRIRTSWLHCKRFFASLSLHRIASLLQWSAFLPYLKMPPCRISLFLVWIASPRRNNCAILGQTCCMIKLWIIYKKFKVFARVATTVPRSSSDVALKKPG